MTNFRSWTESRRERCREPVAVRRRNSRGEFLGESRSKLCFERVGRVPAVLQRKIVRRDIRRPLPCEADGIRAGENAGGTAGTSLRRGKGNAPCGRSGRPRILERTGDGNVGRTARKKIGGLHGSTRAQRGSEKHH